MNACWFLHNFLSYLRSWMECWEGSWAASCLWCCEYKWTLQGTPRVSEKHSTPCCNASRSSCDSKPGHSARITSWALNWSYMMTVKKKELYKMRPPILFFIIGFFHVLFCLGKFIWWSENPDLQYLARTPLGVWSSSEAGPAYLSVELDSEDVVGVTVVADLRPLLEMVDVHALRHSGAHHNYQTAGEKTLHDVNIRSFCRGQRTVGDQYLVSVFGPHACMSLSNNWGSSSCLGRFVLLPWGNVWLFGGTCRSSVCIGHRQLPWDIWSNMKRAELHTEEVTQNVAPHLR